MFEVRTDGLTNMSRNDPPIFKLELGRIGEANSMRLVTKIHRIQEESSSVSFCVLRVVISPGRPGHSRNKTVRKTSIPSDR